MEQSGEYRTEAETGSGVAQRDRPWPFDIPSNYDTAAFFNNSFGYYIKELEALWLPTLIDEDYVRNVIQTEPAAQGLILPARVFQPPAFNVGAVIVNKGAEISKRIVRDLPPEDISASVLEVVTQGFIDDMIEQMLTHSAGFTIVKQPEFYLPFLAFMHQALNTFDMMQTEHRGPYGSFWKFKETKELTRGQAAVMGAGPYQSTWQRPRE